jgi:alpha-L-fucosidase
LELIAHYYNENMKWHKGKLDGVYTLKNHRDQVKFGQYQPGATLLDLERGVVGGIAEQPFNTDTCIGQWQYYEGFAYKTSRQIIEMLVDVVSRNGSFLLSVPQLPDGTIDTYCEGVVDDITRWMDSNGEGIFATRPWSVCGEGPLMTQPRGRTVSERNAKAFSSEDFRFTTKAGNLYVFATPGAAGEGFIIKSLATREKLWPKPVSNVALLGSEEKLQWTQNEDGLKIERPRSMQFPYAVGLKIS